MPPYNLESKGFRKGIVLGFFDATNLFEALLFGREGAIGVAFGIPSQISAFLPTADSCGGSVNNQTRGTLIMERLGDLPENKRVGGG